MEFLPLLIVLAISVVVIIGMWRVFEKDGQPGWGCLIPIYNIYLMCVIAGRPDWWLILFFIPIVSLIVAIVLAIDIASAFGKDALYGIGLAFLPFIFYPILGFGDAQYVGPSAR